MAKPPSGQSELLDHNLMGQRLGRKGRDTRERILTAAQKLLTGPSDAAITLSAVAREATLGMTSLYVYFSDLTELLLAVLAPVMASAEEAYLGHMREPWPDEELGPRCVILVEAYYTFWKRNSRLLHLRNSYSDNGDSRMGLHRVEAAQPVIALMVEQMAGATAQDNPLIPALATVLMTGLERVVTVATDVRLMLGDSAHVHDLLQAEARVLELGLRDGRNIVRGSRN
jgi:AcrR family transcriptional regulator